MRNRTTGILAGLVVGLLALATTLALGGPVSAQDEPSETVEEEGGARSLPLVSAVDATDRAVDVFLLTDDLDITAGDVAAVESGQSVAVTEVRTATEAAVPVELVYVIDVGNRNAGDATLGRVGRAVLDEIRSLPETTSVAVVTAGRDAVVRVPLSRSEDRLERSLLDLRAERGSVLFDSLVKASSVFTNDTGVARSVVVVSGGPDDGSTATAASASATLVQAGAQVIVASVGNHAGLEQVANATGGYASSVDGGDGLVAAIDMASGLAADRLLVTLTGTAQVGQRAPLDLTVAGTTLNLSYAAGVYTDSVAQLEPPPVPDQGGHPLFSNPLVLYGSILLVFATIAMAVWALGSLFIGGESELETLLARYSQNQDDLDEDEIQEMLVQSNLVRRAVDLTEALAEDRGVLLKIEKKLERADIPMRAGEALFFLGAGAFIAFLAVWITSRSVLIALIVGAIIAAAAYFAVQFMARRRLNKFEAQLPDTLGMLSGTLRAGYSLPQGLAAVADEMADPMGEELLRANTEMQLGREIDDALAAVAERLDSPDFAWAVMAIGIQREIGGNLNELLLTVADTMVQRQRLHREVAALTAEGRVSAGILSMLPPGLGTVLYVMNPDYVSVLFSNTVGMILLGAGVLSALVGLIWMKKVITIDV